MNKTFKIIEETDSGDITLETDLSLFEAELALCYYLEHGHDAFIMDEKN